MDNATSGLAYGGEYGMAVPLRADTTERRYNGRCRYCKAHRSVLAVAVKLSRAPWMGYRTDEGAYLAAGSCQVFVSIPCACGRTIEAAPVHGKVKASVVCSSICTGARGHSCECSCGGKNHGRDA